MIKFQFARK